MTVLKSGIWTQDTADKVHQSSPKLANFLSNYLSLDNRVIDFGCGNAFYVAELAKRGYKTVGIEGYALNNFLHSDVLIHDLTKPIDLGFTGAVLSLEVGEHIPKESEQTFLDTITKHCDSDLILSWALPGQPGIGHVNCKPQDYIIDQVEQRGFEYWPIITAEIRQQIDEETDWFTRTLLVFNRK